MDESEFGYSGNSSNHWYSEKVHSFVVIACADRPYKN